jgi:hypothetical protein
MEEFLLKIFHFLIRMSVKFTNELMIESLMCLSQAMNKSLVIIALL